MASTSISNDNVYVADSDNNRIQEFTPSGTPVNTFGQPGTGSDDFQQLRRVAVGSGPPPRCLRRRPVDVQDRSVRPDDTPVQVYGNIPPLPGQFNEPSGMTFDDAGHIFVADAVNQRIERFMTATGAFDLKWGQRGWGNGVKDGFNWPRDITYARRRTPSGWPTPRTTGWSSSALMAHPPGASSAWSAPIRPT